MSPSFSFSRRIMSDAHISENFVAVSDRFCRHQKNDALLRICAEDADIAPDIADMDRREIDASDDLPADKVFG